MLEDQLRATGSSRWDRWIHYIETLSWQSGFLNDSSYKAFLRAGSLGLDEQTVLEEIDRRIRNAGASPRANKLKQQLTSAYRYVGTQPRECNWTPLPANKWPASLPNAIDQIVRSGYGLVDLWEASPLRFDDEDNHTEEIIDTLFPGDPLLCCGRSQLNFATRRREDWRGELSHLSFLVPNPMLTNKAFTAEGKESEHTLEATAARVYLAVEFDFTELDKHNQETTWTPLVRSWQSDGITITDACAALHLHLAERLPLVCVTHSGGKSLHGWYYVFGLLESELRFRFMNYAVNLGADHHTWLRSQFSRIPDGTRENGKRQVCYYLDPGKAVKV